MKKKAKISKAAVIIIVFICLMLLFVIMFVSPAKKLTYGIITDVFTKESKTDTDKRFDNIDKQMRDFEKRGLILIKESDRSKLPSLDYRITINGEGASVTFSNTSGYCEIKIICPHYVSADKSVLCELYNEFAFYGTSTGEIIGYTQSITPDPQTAKPYFFTSSDKEYMSLSNDGLMLIGVVK